MTRIADTTGATGTVVRLTHRSTVLAGNPWNDPIERPLLTYLPPGYDPEGSQDYPVIWYLAAYTNSGQGMGNWRNFGESLPDRLDRLIAAGELGPVIVCAPDCFTRLGGNQYVDSAAIGAYDSYVHDELLPFAEAQLRVRPGRDHRAVVGKSSGGFGALWFGMRHPDRWAAIADQSGDCHFDVSIRGDFPGAAAALARFDFDANRFVDWFWDQPAPKGRDIHALMFLCLAASYDPDPGGSISLPFDPQTLVLDEARWARWLAHDPVTRIDDYGSALRSLERIYLDCGKFDQYHLQFGMRFLAQELDNAGIRHEYTEFDGTHSGIDWRLDHSLPALYEVIG
ncbi:MAG: alpha/beta hydrolase-fold protein [Pseudomonadota bacterium]